MNRIIILAMLSTPAFASTEPIMLKVDAEIQRANALSQSIGRISKKVMTCMKEPGGSAEVCGCSNLETCKFKKEFENTMSLYCAIKTDYPAWQGNTVNYYIEGEKLSHALGMTGLEQQFGHSCK